MSGDSRLNVLGEIGIDDRCRVGGQQSDALGDLVAHRFRWPDDSDRARVALDDHLCSGLDPLQDRSYVFGQVAFANMQPLHISDIASLIVFGLERPGNCYHDAWTLSSDSMTGEILDGKYRIDKQLGAGGMGNVYLATHLGTTRVVALKVIAPKWAAEPQFLARFQREAQACGRLRHPNIVNVTD